MLFDNNDLAPLDGGGCSPLYHAVSTRLSAARAAAGCSVAAGGGGVKMVHFLKTMMTQIKLPL